MKYLVYPTIEEQIVFDDYVHRLAWYIAPLLFDQDNSLVFMVGDKINKNAGNQDYLDSNLPELRDLLVASGKISFAQEKSFFSDTQDEITYLIWDEPNRNSHVKQLQKITGGPINTVRVDHENVQYASSLLLKLTSNDGRGSVDVIKKSKKRFLELVQKLRSTYDRTYIFGTGPYFDTIDLEKLPDGAFIATNSMVANTEALEKLKPEVIIASDPIFHAGCSRYAEKFRDMLIHAMNKYNSYFIFPMRDFGIYITHLPKNLHEKLIPIPISAESNHLVDLSQSFSVPVTQNVMTLLLLPVAYTLRMPIVMGGFDGRPIEEDSYYWGHAKSVQINEEMASIQDAHPAFFKISFNDYYFTHIKKVDHYLSQINKSNRIISITDSHIPAIKAFYHADGPEIFSQKPPQLSIIIPIYNGEEFIDSSLNSILSQSFGKFEVLCINDGSTDSTLEKLNHWQAIDSRVKIFTKENGGVSSARNFGLDRASGQFICFIDIDDFLPQNSLFFRVKKLKSREPVDAVFGRTQTINKSGEILSEYGGISLVSFTNMHIFPMHISSIMLKSSKAKSLRFDENLANGEDWKYFAELARRGVVFHSVERVVSQYRFHPDSVTQKSMDKHLKSMSHIFNYLGTDLFPNELYPLKNQPGLNRSVLEKEFTKRLVQIFIKACFYNDDELAKNTALHITARTPIHGKINWVLNDIENIAVRLFHEPKGDLKLYKKCKKHSDSLLALTSRHANSPEMRSLKSAVKSFLGRIHNHVVDDYTSSHQKNRGKERIAVTSAHNDKPPIANRTTVRDRQKDAQKRKARRTRSNLTSIGELRQSEFFYNSIGVKQALWVLLREIYINLKKIPLIGSGIQYTYNRYKKARG